MFRKLALAVSVVAVSFFPTGTAQAGLIDLFTWDRDGDKTRMEMIDIPLFTFLEIEDGLAESHVEFIDMPLITVFESDDRDHHLSWELLDIPLVTVLEGESGPERSRQEFLTVPILGSAYRYDRDGDNTSMEILYFIHI